MKKAICLLFACALCSVFALTACSSNASSSSSASSNASSSSAASTGAEVTQADIEKMIVGTWVTADRDGKPELTNDKVVFNFVSDTKAYVAAQFEVIPGNPLTWAKALEADVAISGNKVTITDHPSENSTAVSEFTVSAISPDELTANHKLTLTVDGAEPASMEGVCRYVKVDANYEKSILGTWESHSASDGEKDYRCEYKADGTYVFYEKNGDEWVVIGDTLDEYYVSGNLLCERWVNNGQENRESWEISIAGDTMTRTALRQGDDGKTFTESRELKKVA